MSGGKEEVGGCTSGVVGHQREEPLSPYRHPRSLSRHQRFATNEVGGISPVHTIDVCSLQRTRNVGSLHKAIGETHPPESFPNFLDFDSITSGDVRDIESVDCEENIAIVQNFVVFLLSKSVTFPLPS